MNEWMTGGWANVRVGGINKYPYVIPKNGGNFADRETFTPTQGMGKKLGQRDNKLAGLAEKKMLKTANS